MKELDEFHRGLLSGNLMLCNLIQSSLECTFYNKGVVSCTVLLTDYELAAAVYASCSLGILEGAAYYKFRYNFMGFALHIKALRLYRELLDSLGLPEACLKQKMAA